VFVRSIAHHPNEKASIALFGNRHDRGINHLAATRYVALGLQMLAKTLKQLLNQTGLPAFASVSRNSHNVVPSGGSPRAEPQKPRERQPVAHSILGAVRLSRGSSDWSPPIQADEDRLGEKMLARTPVGLRRSGRNGCRGGITGVGLG
jgi:hypothetical protein